MTDAAERGLRYLDARRRHGRGSQKQASASQWPQPLDEAALHGLAGEFVETVAPHTEADPVALLVQFLVAFGNCVGRSVDYGPRYQVEGDAHHANMFAVLVGSSARARKGTSWGRVRQLFEFLEPDVEEPWIKARVKAGLSSGEGLIWQIRDAAGNDDGIVDKRLLVHEGEWATVLRVIARDGNTLSAVIRNAWDRGDLSTLTKNSPARASGAHLSIIGHITADELRRYLDRTEAANGFANRHLFFAVRRARVLPFGGSLDEDAMRQLGRRTAVALGNAKKMGRIRMDEIARAIWTEVYPDLSDGQPGLLGAIIARAEAHVMRLALIYALLDGSDHIGGEHLIAALAVWQYSEASVRYVFGDALGDPVADEILAALRVGPRTRTELRDLFKRHRSGAQIGRALALLEQLGRATCEKASTGGRPSETWSLAREGET